MPNLDPAESLVSVASSLEEGALPDPADSARFVLGVRSWLNEGIPLEVALGLNGSQGRESARTRYRRAVRNRYLREAHVLCEGDSPWKRSVSLEREVKQFILRIWPRWRSLDAPPVESSELRRALFNAMQQKGTLPESTRALHDICCPRHDGKPLFSMR